MAEGKTIASFQATPPQPQLDLELGLLAHLRQFLVEPGVGFAFVGSQVPLEVGGEDFKLDHRTFLRAAALVFSRFPKAAFALAGTGRLLAGATPG